MLLHECLKLSCNDFYVIVTWSKRLAAVNTPFDADIEQLTIFKLHNATDDRYPVAAVIGVVFINCHQAIFLTLKVASVSASLETLYSDVGFYESGKVRDNSSLARSIGLIWGDLIRLMVAMFHLAAPGWLSFRGDSWFNMNNGRRHCIFSV